MKRTLSFILLTIFIAHLSLAKVIDWCDGQSIGVESKIKLKENYYGSSKWQFRVFKNAKNKISCYIIDEIIEFNKAVTIAKGTKMMLRTGSGNVYEGYTEIEYSNKDTRHIDNSIIHNSSNNSVITLAKEQYNSFYVAYYFPEKAFRDIAKSGILKIRRYGWGYDENFKNKIYNKQQYVDYNFDQKTEKNNKTIFKEFTEMWKRIDNPKSEYIEQLKQKQKTQPKKTPKDDSF